jgi:hypothetical protein
MSVVGLVPKRSEFDYNSSAEVVISAGLLGKGEEPYQLMALKAELEDNFNKTQVFRTRTEMEVSVLNDIKFPTPASKYWQAVREQNVMFTELVMLSFEYRKVLVEIRMLKRDLDVEEDPLRKELLQIELDRHGFIQKQMIRTAKARLKEILNWSDIKLRESKSMSEEELAEVGNSQLVGYVKRWIGQSMIMGVDGSPSERQNLLGQLRSGITAAHKTGILDKVLEGFPKEVKNKIKLEYGF